MKGAFGWLKKFSDVEEDYVCLIKQIDRES